MKIRPLGLALLIPCAILADNLDTPERGVRFSTSMRTEGKDSGGIDVDRWLITTGWDWESGRRENISLRIPYQVISSTAPAGSADARGFQDASLNYSFAARDLAHAGRSTRWSVDLNLPIGKEGLNAEEGTAFGRLGAAAVGFLNPQFTRGFGAGVRHTWNRVQGTSRSSFFLAYNFATSYTLNDAPGNRVDNSGVDTWRAGWNRSFEKETRTFNVGAQVIGFGDSTTTTNGVATEVDSDPNLLLSFRTVNRRTDRYATNVGFTYQFRDAQDSLQPGIGVNPTSIELGDRLFWDATIERSDSPQATWRWGLSGQTTFASERGGAKVAGSDAHEAFARVGYRRTQVRGGALDLVLDVGLTSDARDYSLGATYSRGF